MMPKRCASCWAYRTLRRYCSAVRSATAASDFLGGGFKCHAVRRSAVRFPLRPFADGIRRMGIDTCEVQRRGIGPHMCPVSSRQMTGRPPETESSHARGEAIG